MPKNWENSLCTSSWLKTETYPIIGTFIGLFSLFPRYRDKIPIIGTKGDYANFLFFISVIIKPVFNTRYNYKKVQKVATEQTKEVTLM